MVANAAIIKVNENTTPAIHQSPIQNPALFSRHPAKHAATPVCPAVGGSDPGAGWRSARRAGLLGLPLQNLRLVELHFLIDDPKERCYSILDHQVVVAVQEEVRQPGLGLMFGGWHYWNHENALNTIEDRKCLYLFNHNLLVFYLISL